LNPSKLLDVGFSHLPQGIPKARYLKMNKIGNPTQLDGLRAMEKDDVKAVHKLLNGYLSKFKLHIQFTVGEIAHFFLPRDNVIESFVVVNR
jgi:glycylpeptide N-tetradecanoyltransferase